ncbi:beta-ketoacyl synthase N-terminal-like domain-containing protein [Streptomyces naphthomycinicus]|uniref:beta-ketoacyl synthase N-terminal-like domain-containing protein n=1 Tax=Streptomyces naphthomycinicus TaxID=2872625 RepID=UPI001CECDBDA|nr:beta-ketoacyl synthase N-terminal-like domain-containing protein [Streptomyces sp. TML10]
MSSSLRPAQRLQPTADPAGLPEGFLGSFLTLLSRSQEGLDLFDAAIARNEPTVVPARPDIAWLARGGSGPLVSVLGPRVHCRNARRTAAAGSAADGRSAGMPAADVKRALLEAVRAYSATVLGHQSPQTVRPDSTFKDIGFDSLSSVELRNRLSAGFGVRLSPTAVFDHPTPAAMARYLRGELLGEAAGAAQVVVTAATQHEPVAIVGMSRIGSPEKVWKLLASGSQGIAGLPTDRSWDLKGRYDPAPYQQGKSYVREGGFLCNAGGFDAGFFSIVPRETLAVDPQQRLLADTTWGAFVRSCTLPESLHGIPTGVFAGAMPHAYDALLHDAPEGVGVLLLTSRSTRLLLSGRPKGVGVTHRAIGNRLAWMQGAYGLTADALVLQKTPAGFHGSVWEPLPALRDIAAVTYLAAPDGYRGPVDRGWTGSLRRVSSSGEAVTGSAAHRWHEPTGVPLHNVCCATVTALDIAHHRCHRASDTAVPIGRPGRKTGLLVLDTGLRPVPDGVPGELYLTGVQPARGDHRRAALTADRFVANPYAPEPGARMYRTSDLVRRRPDGALDYLGRTDHQDKLRGSRVEPEHLRAESARVPGVTRDSVIIQDLRIFAADLGIADADADAGDVPGEPDAAAPPLPDRPVDHAARRFTHVRNRLPRAARFHPAATPTACTRPYAQTRHNTILAGTVPAHAPTAKRCAGSRPGHPDHCVHSMVPTANEPRCHPTRQAFPGRWPCVLTGPGPRASGDRLTARQTHPGRPTRHRPAPMSRRPGAGIPFPAAGSRIPALDPLGRSARRPVPGRPLDDQQLRPPVAV